MTSEEQFFKQVKGHFEGYSPDVPGNVYSGLRRRMWWGGFMKLDATRFNAWYLLLLLGAASAGTIAVVGSDPVVAKGAENSSIELTSVMPAAPVMIGANENNSCCVLVHSCNNVSQSNVTASLPAIVEPDITAVGLPTDIEPEITEVVDPIIITQPEVVDQQPAKLEETADHGSITDQLKSDSDKVYITTPVYKKK